MTIALLHRPFDESFARDSIPALRSAGYTDAIRYAIGAGKAITRAEWNAFLAAGMSVTLVDEAGAQMGLSGYHGGMIRATLVNQVFDSLGVPRSPVRAAYYATEDPSPRPGTYRNDVQFFLGVQIINAQYGGGRFGPYGSGAMIDYVMSRLPAATLGWCVRTWGVSAHATLIQEPNPTMSTLGGSVDENTAMVADWGQFPQPVLVVTPATPPPPPAPPAPPIIYPEDQMKASRVTIAFGNGRGWCAAPDNDASKVVNVTIDEQSPGVVGSYIPVPAFVGPAANGNELVFAPGPLGTTPDGTYGGTAWSVTA